MKSSSSLSRENASLPQDSANAAQEEMNIYMKVMKTVSFAVKRTETVKNLKAMVRAKYGYPENIQELFFIGERLADTQTLVDCGINKDSTVNLIIQSFKTIKISIKLISDQKTIVLEARTCDTIKKIKTEIQNVAKVPSEDFTLFYDGKLLNDDSTLASLKVQSDSTFYLVLTPKEVIPISVRQPNGHLVKIEVKVVFTVRDVKTMIDGMTSVPSGDFHLVFSRGKLEDCRTLAYYGIKEGSILDMLLQEKFEIFIATPTGKTITLDVSPDDTIKAVKLKYCQKMKISSSFYWMRLTYYGSDLIDDKTVASYNIRGCTLYYED